MTFDELLAAALEVRATHVHLEGGRVRFRVDGVLRPTGLAPVPVDPGVVDLAHHRVICRGPVLRIVPRTPEPLGSSGRVPDPLGRAHALLEAALTHRQGLIFLTGPARSGLSTSLAAWAGLLDCERAHVAHWADDGLSLPGCTSVRNATLTELIDLDLDVLLLDKKRDFGPEQLREVARLAQRALVICVWPGWSDVCEFLLRCKEIGLVTSHIRTVVNQRLIRLLCPACKQTCLLDHPLIKEGTSGFKAGGCPECDHVGYRGQLPLFEVVEVGGELRDLLLRQTTLVRLRQTTFIEALFRDGLEQVKAGLTSLEEAERVLGPAPPELTLD